jgi:hypothetical protein
MQISLSTGRIFRRTNRDGIGLIGVVEVPIDLQTEGVHLCLIQAGVMLVDRLEARPLLNSVGEKTDPGSIKDEPADSFFYRSYASDSSGAQQFFFRESVLPPSAPDMKWCYITGARRLAIPQLSGDGMYELGAQLRKVQLPSNFGEGMNLGGLLREPVWGPGGAYGLAHSLEPGFFPYWAVQDRARNAKQDPKFAAYMEAMARHGEPPLYYTAAQQEEREALADRVLREILDAEDVPRPRAA